jgi:hypothetical protein
MPVLLDLGKDKPRRKYVIRGTCPVCGVVPGCEARDLTGEEWQALKDLDYDLTEDVFGRDIAAPPTRKGYYNQALFEFHRAGHPKPTRPTWHELLLKGLED